MSAEAPLRTNRAFIPAVLGIILLVACLAPLLVLVVIPIVMSAITPLGVGAIVIASSALLFFGTLGWIALVLSAGDRYDRHVIARDVEPATDAEGNDRG